MRAEGLAARVAVEQRRKNPVRQRRGDEERIGAQRAENHLAELLRGGMILRDLHVVLRLCGLVAGGDLAIHPRRLVEDLPRGGELGGVEDVGNSG